MTGLDETELDWMGQGQIGQNGQDLMGQGWIGQDRAVLDWMQIGLGWIGWDKAVSYGIIGQVVA